VLVSAPAGFGKTTLLSQWLAAEGQGDGRVTWLSLGPEESDLRRFLTRVVDALEGSIGTFGAEARALLQTDRAVPAESVVGSLVTDLDQLAGPTVLALDDYHAIDATEVHDAVTFLVENLPPQATLAIATRADPPLPLPRLRSRGELLELRATDLRFTADEARMFLNEVMGLDVSPEQVDALDSRTEGWAAGLQLAALSVLPESFDRPFAVPTGLALIGLGISLWRTQHTSAPAAAPVAVASAVLAPAGAES
jgi:LuxR family transcriptional regulator, maltose regulon positive regulatory protein